MIRTGSFSWKQFGRPSGVFIDKNDVIYVADSQSSEKTRKAARMMDWRVLKARRAPPGRSRPTFRRRNPCGRRRRA
jgi:hypothetical protein